MKTNPKSGPNFPSIEGALYRRKPSLFCFLTGGLNWGDSAPRGHWAVSGDIGGCRDWGCSRRRVGGDRCSTPCSAVLPQSPLSPRRDPGTGQAVKLLCIKRSWRPSASLWGTAPNGCCGGHLSRNVRPPSAQYTRLFLNTPPNLPASDAGRFFLLCLFFLTFNNMDLFFFFPDSVLKLQE